jgi:hypothetical protein
LSHLVGAKKVTTIDLSDAFFQMMLHADSQPLTAFYSEAHGKRFCFKQCPQGLRNSPLHLKLLMDKLFGDMANEVIHYADNILIATNGTVAHHLKIGKLLAFKKLPSPNTPKKAFQSSVVSLTIGNSYTNLPS